MTLWSRRAAHRIKRSKQMTLMTAKWSIIKRAGRRMKWMISWIALPVIVGIWSLIRLVIYLRL